MKNLAILLFISVTTLEATNWFNARHSPKMFQYQIQTQYQPMYDQSHIQISWTEWSEWSPCSKTCGAGRQSRKRSKLQKIPNYYVEEVDSETEYADCNHRESGIEWHISWQENRKQEIDDQEISCRKSGTRKTGKTRKKFKFLSQINS